METASRQPRGNNTSPAGCLLRAFWMLVGNAILLLCALSVIGEGFVLGLADLLYWLTVIGLVGARYADIRYLGGRTAEGTPATMAHARRYSAIVVAVSAVIWTVLHLLPDSGF